MDNDTPLDMLQIKIERAKEELPKETRHAIDSVDWRGVILGMREKKGYSFEQLEDLELETELLLCGLLNPANYPKELEKRMNLPKAQVDLLVNEMNEFVFKKIKNELIKNTEREEIFIKKADSITNDELRMTNQKAKEIIPEKPKIIEQTASTPVLSNKTELETMPPEIPITPETTPKISETTTPTIKDVESISSQKLAGSFQIPTKKTEYTLPTLGKDKLNLAGIAPKKSDDDILKTSKEDPYRIDPNE